MSNKLYVQYGCGKSAPDDWVNFDVSPTLRIQKAPILGLLLKSQLDVEFPKNVVYGDIIKGLPNIKPDSCDGVYCSHVLEHLSLEDFHTALRNTYKILKPGGVFRCIVPDLEFAIQQYISELKSDSKNANSNFLKYTYLGQKSTPKGIKARLKSLFGNDYHRWMWDHPSLTAQLENAGFKNVRTVRYGDYLDNMFEKVEYENRLINAVALECVK